MGGGAKALRLLGGRTLLAHVLARLDPLGERRAGGQIVLSANGDPSRFAAFGLPVLADAVGSGPLAGVLAGMQWAAANGHPSLLSVPSDCPFLPVDLAERLAAASSPVACAASQGRVHHATALWSVTLQPELATALRQGAQRVGLFTAGRAVVVDFEPTACSPRGVDPFLNLNTPADLLSAAALLTAGEGMNAQAVAGSGR